ncbi:MAG: M48 family metalloprotease, partial [Patescibacteria group bacterium]|nr:M48 family metalloprotease [Patescibacteria group bacterium]
MLSQIDAWMFRIKGEYWALFISICLVILAAILLSSFNIYLFIGLAILGLVLVKMQQSQYMGDSVRVHESQYPKIFEIFKEHARKLGIHKASLYIKQDPTLNAYTIGFSSCSVVLTSALVEQLNLKELSFVLGHELGHFKAG